jgi:hypothetical protein
MEKLPTARGHFAGGWLFASGPVRVELLPEEPPALSPILARKWHSGDLIFESVEFEGDAEGNARARLEEDLPIGDVKGASPSLRNAFGYALLLRRARETTMRVSPLEARSHLVPIADGGRYAAEALLRNIALERQDRGLAQRVRHALAGRRDRRATRENAEDRAFEALRAAGARPLASRLTEDAIEVTWTFLGERFISLADVFTLQIIDSGVCLAGSDSEVTLESLPSVIREAIDDGVLVITRHS